MARVKNCEVMENGFAGCCGIVILHSARSTNYCNDHRQYLAAAVKEPANRAGLYLYSLNQDQVEEREQLLKAGFEELKSFINPRHGSTVTLYGKLPEPPKKRKKKPAARRRARAVNPQMT